MDQEFRFQISAFGISNWLAVANNEMPTRLNDVVALPNIPILPIVQSTIYVEYTYI